MPGARRRAGPPGRQHRPGRRRCPAPRRGGPEPATPAATCRGRPAGRTGDRRRRRHGGRGAGGPRPAGWAYGVDLASRDSATVGRHDRHQRRWAAGAALRRHPGPGGRGGGRARHRRGGLPPGRAPEGQHRLPPAGAALRERGDPRRGDGGPAPPGAAGPRAGGGPAGLRRRTGPAVSAAAVLRRSLPSLGGGRALPPTAGWSWSAGSPGRPAPFPAAHPAYLLVEAAAQTDPRARAGRRPSTRWTGWPTWRWPPTRSGRPSCGATARPTPRRSTRLGAPHKLDVTLPAGALAEFVERVPAGGRPPSPRRPVRWLFGHVADGNVHVNVTGRRPGRRPGRRGRAPPGRRGSAGSISAEHGIGTAKRRWLAPQPERGRDRRLPGHQATPSTPTACSTRTCCCPRSEPARGASGGRASRRRRAARPHGLGEGGRPLPGSRGTARSWARPGRAAPRRPGRAHAKAGGGRRRQVGGSRPLRMGTADGRARSPRTASMSAWMRGPLAGRVTTSVGPPAAGETLGQGAGSRCPGRARRRGGPAAGRRRCRARPGSGSTLVERLSSTKVDAAHRADRSQPAARGPAKPAAAAASAASSSGPAPGRPARARQARAMQGVAAVVLAEQAEGRGPRPSAGSSAPTHSDLGAELVAGPCAAAGAVRRRRRVSRAPGWVQTDSLSA